MRLVATSWRDATESAIRDVAQRSSDSPTTETPIAEPTKTFKEPEAVASTVQTGIPTGKVRVWHGSTVELDAAPSTKAAVETPGAVFFTDNDNVADAFRHPRAYGEIDWDASPGSLVQADIELNNPLVLDGPDAQRFTDDSIYQMEVVLMAKRNGHDGIIARGVREGVGTDVFDPSNTYVVFDDASIDVVGGLSTNPKSPDLHTEDFDQPTQSAKVDPLQELLNETAEIERNLASGVYPTEKVPLFERWLADNKAEIERIQYGSRTAPTTETPIAQSVASPDPSPVADASQSTPQAEQGLGTPVVKEPLSGKISEDAGKDYEPQNRPATPADAKLARIWEHFSGLRRDLYGSGGPRAGVGDGGNGVSWARGYAEQPRETSQRTPPPLVTPHGEASVTRTYQPSETMRKWFGGAQAEAYPVHELDPTDTNREVFKKTLLEVYEGSDVGKQVQDPLSPDFDLTNARMFVVGEGDAVFALKGDDIVYAGKVSGSKAKNVAYSMLQLAVDEGGRKPSGGSRQNRDRRAHRNPVVEFAYVVALQRNAPQSPIRLRALAVDEDLAALTVGVQAILNSDAVVWTR